jgi:UDPglucose 6-dehydrogenase
LNGYPSLAILPNLIDKGAVIHAHDPQGMEEAKKQLPVEVGYFKDVYEAIDGADAIILLTEWNEYRGLDFDRLKQVMRGNAFIDLRNVYAKSHLTGLGFNYTCVGQ